ncbi:hypothetical protein STIAU_8197 [Stigmatella aurantiaca DW4/3-1]|uniref:Uncharacterized protein n=1 Tax=Stigmatella aurantiaca (strain DW4/3-1) TaxID=378806 RepID=Q08R58_STIAD|nr:hypothetical protein STIAU_8197 [Stigmatella aurantiaca DW4/3-1]
MAGTRSPGWRQARRSALWQARPLGDEGIHLRGTKRPGHGVQGGQHGHVLARGGAQLLEAPGPGKNAHLQGAHGGVVRIHGPVQVAAQVAEMAGQRPDAVIQRAPQLTNLMGVAGHVLLAPAVGHGAQQGNERGGRGEDDLPVHPRLDEGGVLLQRGAEERLARQEHHHELRGGRKLLPVGLVAQGLEVGARLRGVLAQLHQPGTVVADLQGLQVGLERGLGVHHHALVAGQAHHHVRTQAPALVGDGLLLDEVTALHHAGQLHHAPQLDLPPPPAHGGGAQGAHEAGRLGAQGFLGGGERLELLGEAAIGLGPRLLQVGDLRIHLLQGLAQGPHHGLDGALALGEVRARALLEARELKLGEFQEGLVVHPQRIGGEGLEGLGQLVPRLGKQLQLLLHAPALLGRGGLERGQPHLQPGAGILELPDAKTLGIQRPAHFLEFPFPAAQTLGQGGAPGLFLHPDEAGFVLEAALEEQPGKTGPQQASGDEQGKGEDEGHGGPGP